MKIALTAALLTFSAAAFAAPAPKAAAVDKSTLTPVSPEELEQAGAHVELILRDVEAMVAEFEGTARGGADGSSCPPGFNLRNYLRDRKEKKGEKELGSNVPDADGAKLGWEYYNTCLALAAKSENSCNEIADIARDDAKSGESYYNKAGGAALAASQTQRDSCVKGYTLERVKVAYIMKDPGFAGICKAAAPYLPPMKSPASLDAICAAWQAALPGNLSALSSAIMAGVREPLKAEYAMQTAREMVTDPAWCAGVQEADTKLSCTELGDLRAAGRNPAACKGGLCRMALGGGAAACEPYAAKLKKQLCKRFYGTKYSGERSAVIDQRLKEAEQLLAASGRGAATMRQAQLVQQRLDRLYELRDRAFKADKVLGPLGNPGPKPTGKPQ